MVVTGTLNNKGMMVRVYIAVLANMAITTGVGLIIPQFSDNASGGVVSLNAPTGGVAQFKGLTQSAIEDKYVNVTCVGIQLMFWTTAWKDLSTGLNNGYMVNCYTGITNCEYAYNGVQLSLAERTSCLADPRYLTYRQMLVKYEYDGTLVWWRTDSYWDQTSYIAASTWGPAL